MQPDKPKDVKLLNTLLALSVKGYSGGEVSITGDLADMKNQLVAVLTIVVLIVAALLVAAIAATVLVMKGRGTGAHAEVERRAANVPPTTTQPNPAFNPANAADAVLSTA